MENAVHFTSEGGRIEIAGVSRPDGCTIRVSDDGPGIAETDLPHVFERFWHRLPPDGPMGSGLGLAMARATARAWGGDVKACDGPGRGSGLRAEPSAPDGRSHRLVGDMTVR